MILEMLTSLSLSLSGQVTAVQIHQPQPAVLVQECRPSAFDSLVKAAEDATKFQSEFSKIEIEWREGEEVKKIQIEKQNEKWNSSDPRWSTTEIVSLLKHLRSLTQTQSNGLSGLDRCRAGFCVGPREGGNFFSPNRSARELMATETPVIIHLTRADESRTSISLHESLATALELAPRWAQGQETLAVVVQKDGDRSTQRVTVDAMTKSERWSEALKGIRNLIAPPVESPTVSPSTQPTTRP